MTEGRLRQYIIMHKAFTPPADPSFVPLQVGFGEDLGYLRDNTKDNIASKNKSWCELTGLYWIWKNDTESDWISISHYRRYFGKNKAMSGPEILKALDGYDVCLAEFEPYRESVYEQYCIESGFAQDLDTLREILAAKSKKDVQAWDAIMAQGGISQYNMMACSKARFDDYCAWLFPILEELEKQISLDGRNAYQQRIYGFLSERLLNVYVRSRDLRTHRLPVWQPELSRSQKLRLSLRRVKNRMIFSLSKKHSTPDAHA